MISNIYTLKLNEHILSMTYLEQLKQKYPEDIKKAYQEYILSKTIYRSFYVSEDAPDFVKEAMQIQKKLNEYVQSIINSEKKTLSDILGKTQEQLISYIQDKEEIFDFLEIERGNLIQHLTGMYESKLKQSIPKDLTWDRLKDIMNEENNNLPILKEEEVVNRLEKIAKTFGVNSITYGKVRTTEAALDKLENSFTQLQQVIDCNPQQVGLKKFNVFLDIAEFNYAGSASGLKGQIKLYINERLSHDAFAHEWLHGIDMLMADIKSKGYEMYSQSNKGHLSKLLTGLKKADKEDFNKIKETALNDTEKFIQKIVDRFNLMASINNPQELKEKLLVEIDKVKEGTFNENKALEMINEYMKDSNGCPSYLITELNMLEGFLKNKDFTNSYFYEYAKEMQNSLKKTGLMEDEYSTLKEEMFARAFESFTQVKLEEKNLKNDIAHANVSGWTPKAIETIRQKALWADVLQEMKEVMEIYLPQKAQLKSNAENTEYIKHNIGKIRKTFNNSEEQKIAVKIK